MKGSYRFPKLIKKARAQVILTLFVNLVNENHLMLQGLENDLCAPIDNFIILSTY